MVRGRELRSGIAAIVAMGLLVMGGTTASAADVVTRAIGVSDNYTACAIMPDRTVTCWGDNEYHGVGNGTEDEMVLSPDEVERAAGPLVNVTKLDMGSYHACAVRQNATAVCWGENEFGKLGPGNADPTPFAVQVAGLTNVIDITAGLFHSCALKGDGTVWCWGSDSNEDLGNGPGGSSLTPVQVLKSDGPLGNVVDIDAGHRTTCALQNTGKVRCWGENAFGQLTTGNSDPSPFAVVLKQGTSAAADIRQIDVGVDHLCVVKTSGAALCAGLNSHGQLGIGTQDDRATLARVRLGRGFLQDVRSIDAAGLGTCAIAGANGQVYCWGNNANAQVGDGTTGTNRFKATAVKKAAGGLLSARSLAFGDSVGCAQSPRAVLCWGYNGYGTIGIGTTGDDATKATKVIFPS